MNSTFEKALGFVLAHEGGFVNHPRDPGGATNRGITQATFDAWRRQNGLQKETVEDITDDEVAKIYRVQYWDAVRANELPVGLDYALFDFAVNSGPSRAVKFLQRIVGVDDDGAIGTMTMDAVTRYSDLFGVERLIQRLCDDRLAWMKRLQHWNTFGRGWTRRVMGGEVGFQKYDTGVIDRAIRMANEWQVTVPPPISLASDGADMRTTDTRASVPAQARDNAGNLVATLVGAGGVPAVLASDPGPVLEAAMAVAMVAAVMFLLWRQWRSEA